MIRFVLLAQVISLPLNPVPNPVPHVAQNPGQNSGPVIPTIPRDLPPSTQPLEDPDTLLRRSPLPAPPLPIPTVPTPPDRAPPTTAFQVKHFVLQGSRVFDQVQIDAITQEFLNRDISFADVLQARSRIIDLYVSKGYITTGAYVPEQDIETGGDVIIAIVEGRIEAIQIKGTQRLNPSYLRSRIFLAAEPPLNRDRLLQGLQLLRLNPLIQNLSATLEGTPRPGRSILTIEVQEADSFDVQASVNNGRSPSVGTLRRGVQIIESNLLGFADSLSLAYSNTQGSNALDLSYTVPLSPHNTTLSFSYGTSKSSVIEDPFDILDITSKSRYYELTLRQPLHESPTSELALGLTFSRRESQTKLGFANIGPFPLSTGADDQGRTSIAALRFFQEWTQRSNKQVVAARSQFSLGLNAFDATHNAETPDSSFFTWRGQAQWVRLLGNDPEALVLLRADMQLADRSLLSIEQFGLGGFDSVRGYRQDALLTDNGLFASIELRLPVARIPHWDSTIVLTPFLEFGHGWNHDFRLNPDSNTLLSTGLGVRWRVGDRFLARIDWGIPLLDLETEKRTLQEQGLYFSLLWHPF
jgi:hemolysin activation/secretion protein